MPSLRLDLALLFALGLASSLHCVTMCGPLIAVASAPLLEQPGARWRALLRWQLAYHLGRAVTYGVLGALLGLTGKAITSLFAARYVGGLVQTGLGLAIVAIGVAQLFRRRVQAERGGRLTLALPRLVTSGHGLGILGLGLLTGLLPCGVLYAALARSMAAGSGWQGAILMLAFWLGTVPLLAGVALVARPLLRAAGRYATVLLVVATLAVGGWLTAKGVRTLCAPSTSAKASCHARLAPARLSPGGGGCGRRGERAPGAPTIEPRQWES